MSTATESPIQLVFRPYPIGRESAGFQRAHDAKHQTLRKAQAALALDQPA